MKLHTASLAACVGLFVFASASHAGTPNTIAAGAVSYEVGGGWVTHGVDESSQNRWFAFTELAGRSYCVEAALGPATYFPLDPNLTLYSDSAGTVVYLSNSDGVAEPPQNKGSRVCYQSPQAVGATMVRLFKVNVPITAGSGDSGFVRARVVDTTLIFPTFSVSNDSNGGSSGSMHLYISNTTTTDINATVYIPGYGALKTFTGNSVIKAQNQATGKSIVRDQAIKAPGGVPSWSWNGVAYLMHDGPPNALEVWGATSDPGSNMTWFPSPR